MAVGIKRQDFVNDESLDGPKSAARGDIVGIDKCLRTERPDDLGIVAHEIVCDMRMRVVDLEPAAEIRKELYGEAPMWFRSIHATNHLPGSKKAETISIPAVDLCTNF